MGVVVRDRRWPMTWVAVLVIAGCAATTPTPTPTITPVPTASMSPNPSLDSTPPTPTATPSPVTPTPTPAATAVPPPTTWRAVPGQSSVTGATFLDVVWTGTRFVASGGQGFYLNSTDGVTWHAQRGVAKRCGSVLATGTGGVISVGRRRAACRAMDSCGPRLRWHSRCQPRGPARSRSPMSSPGVTAGSRSVGVIPTVRSTAVSTRPAPTSGHRMTAPSGRGSPTRRR